MSDQGFDLIFSHTIVERTLHVTLHFRRTVMRGQHRNGDETAIPFGDIRLLPDVAKEHVIAKLTEFRNEFIDGLLGPLFPPF